MDPIFENGNSGTVIGYTQERDHQQWIFDGHMTALGFFDHQTGWTHRADCSGGWRGNQLFRFLKGA